MFLYRDVLRIDVEVPAGVLRPRRHRRVPVVLTRAEVVAVLDELQGTQRLVAALLYGAGLRLMEALQLRVKDIALERDDITARSGKGGDDRIAILPAAPKPELRRQLRKVTQRHEADIQRGAGYVALPDAFARKSPGAARELAWQWLFPAARTHRDSATDQLRRHHLHETAVQRAVRAAVLRSGIAKRASCHTFRHSFATHLLEDGCHIENIRQLLGHRNIRTTMIYLHVLEGSTPAVRSPLDRLDFRF